MPTTQITAVTYDLIDGTPTSTITLISDHPDLKESTAKAVITLTHDNQVLVISGVNSVRASDIRNVIATLQDMINDPDVYDLNSLEGN